MDRVMIGVEEAKQAILGKTCTRFEFVSGGSDRDEDDYFILDFGLGEHSVTLYASAPSVYRDLLPSERVDG